jgi:hypothetical protein
MDQQTVDRELRGMGGVAVDEAYDTFFYFYDPDGTNPDNRKFPFATLVTSDAVDQMSDLNRPGVYRLNFGVSRATFRSLFPEDADQDYTALDTLLPHPVYAAQSWVSVLNPGEATFARLKPFLAEAYERAVRRFKRP